MSDRLTNGVATVWSWSSRKKFGAAVFILRTCGLMHEHRVNEVYEIYFMKQDAAATHGGGFMLPLQVVQCLWSTAHWDALGGRAITVQQ